MKSSIPSGSEVKALLLKLRRSEVQKLSALSGVSFSTIRNIRDHSGEPNPGIDTVRQFWPHLPAVKAV